MVEQPLYIGIGNALRRDDGVGPWLADRLRRHGLRARAWVTDGGGLIDLFDTEANMVLIDAARSGAPPGTIHRFDATRQEMPRKLFHNSSHEFGLAEAVEVGRRLGQLPRLLQVIGIEGEDFGPGEGLSPAVHQVAQKLAATLARAPGSI